MEKLLFLRVTAYYKNIKLIKNATEYILELLGFNEDEVYMYKLAIAEASANIIEHGYQGENENVIEFEIHKGKDDIIFSLRDFGRTVELDKIKSRDLEEYDEGGLGVHIMKSVMDDVKYEPQNDGTLLVMRKLIGDDKRE